MTERVPAPFDLCYLREREDIRGHEEGKAQRPWLVLSNERLNSRGLFLGCSVTSAPDRSARGFLCGAEFTAGASGFVDTQQLWAFPLDRDDTRPPEPRLVTKYTAQVRERITEHLETSQHAALESPVSVGRLVWVELLDRPDRQESDLAVLQEALGASIVLGTFLPPRLACLVIATDAAARADDPAVFELITVVPLVAGPQPVGTPTIPMPDGLPQDAPTELFALTYALLTVDYRENPTQRVGNTYIQHRRRVYLDVGNFCNWRAPDDALKKVVADVRDLLGVSADAACFSDERLAAQAPLALAILRALPDPTEETQEEMSLETAVSCLVAAGTVVANFSREVLRALRMLGTMFEPTAVLQSGLVATAASPFEKVLPLDMGGGCVLDVQLAWSERRFSVAVRLKRGRFGPVWVVVETVDTETCDPLLVLRFDETDLDVPKVVENQDLAFSPCEVRWRVRVLGREP